MVDPIKEKLAKWSLKRIQFLLSHIEGFVETENHDLIERARNFSASSELHNVEKLIEIEPSDSRLPTQLLEGLSSFFESGLLIQRGPAQETTNWWVTHIFCRGNTFHLELQDQLLVNNLVPEMTPLQVHRAAAKPLLEKIKLAFLLPGSEAEAYLLRPTPTVAYLLITNLAPPWSEDHLRHTQRLVNKCFIY